MVLLKFGPWTLPIRTGRLGVRLGEEVDDVGVDVLRAETGDDGSDALVVGGGVCEVLTLGVLDILDVLNVFDVTDDAGGKLEAED